MRAPRLIAAVAAVPLALAACSSSSSTGTSSATSTAASTGASASASAEPVTITLWHGQTADAAKAMEDLAADYHKSHPLVTIKVAPGASTTDELKQKIAAGFVADTYPDVSYTYGSWAGELAQLP
jgi:multiple sugar transport system substrate-binding protein